MENESLILGTRFRKLKNKPIYLQISKRTGHVQLLRMLAEELQTKTHRWPAETHDRVIKHLFRYPRDIHIDGAHFLDWKALEVLRDIWDETRSEGPRATIRIVLNGTEGFREKVKKKNPQLWDRAFGFTGQRS